MVTVTVTVTGTLTGEAHDRLVDVLRYLIRLTLHTVRDVLRHGEDERPMYSSSNHIAIT